MLYAVYFICTPHQCAVLERGWECYNGCKLSAAYQYKALSMQCGAMVCAVYPTLKHSERGPGK